jgi:hypothetical protein
MNPTAVLSYLAQAASFAAAVVLLVLQLRAFRRHHHLSFALLSVSTVAAVLYFFCWQIVAMLTYKGSSAPVWLNFLSTAFFLIQIIFGLWGTISLFNSYGELSEAGPGSAEGVTAGVQAGAPEVATSQASALATPPSISKPTFFERLNDIARLWLLRPSRNPSAMATELWVVILGLLTLSLWIVLDRSTVGPNAIFMSWNVPALGSCVLLALGWAYIGARVSTPNIPYRLALYIVAAVAPLLIAAWWLVNTRIGTAIRLLEPLVVIYAFTYTALNLRRLTGSWQVRSIALLLMIFGLTYAADQQSYWSASVWVAPPAEGEDYVHSAQKSESLLFDQRSKIDAVVQGFDTATENRPRVFFVGFAGVASRRVFAEEIKLSAKNVAARFNVKDRQLLLLNDRRDLNVFAIGTVTALTYGLKSIGQKMDPDRDILFLALSSHGSSEPAISVSNNVLSLQQLTGDDLSTALKASGIKRRIIVISACHAAAFIPVLKDPNTIIITAAAADKASFGCSDDRDLTYFGEAFYRDALPNATSIEDAFNKAKAAIALREAREGQKPSDPQAYFGSELQQVLEANPMTPLGSR